MKLSINEAVFSISKTDKNEIDELITQIENLKFAEVWIYGENETKLCILINEQIIFCMFMDDREDTSYILYNEIEDEGYEDFLLSNGQMDEYPKTSIADRNMLKEVIDSYLFEQKRTEKLNWIEG